MTPHADVPEKAQWSHFEIVQWTPKGPVVVAKTTVSEDDAIEQAKALIFSDKVLLTVYDVYEDGAKFEIWKSQRKASEYRRLAVRVRVVEVKLDPHTGWAKATLKCGHTQILPKAHAYYKARTFPETTICETCSKELSR